MNDKYTQLFSIIAIIGWTAFAIVIVKLEPCLAYSGESFCKNIATSNQVMFYSSLFIALLSTFTALIIACRSYIIHVENQKNYINIALRQGTLLSICTTASLILLSMHLLRWWSALTVITVTILVELYFLRKV